MKFMLIFNLILEANLHWLDGLFSLFLKMSNGINVHRIKPFQMYRKTGTIIRLPLQK